MSSSLHLCDLPDHILISILSLLPIQSAVSTSLLSRRWQSLWTSVTKLKLSDYIFRDRSKFIDFVDRALMLRHGSSLESFSLVCCVLEDASRVNSWITAAIQCNVRKLTLCLSVLYSYVFPTCIFRYQSLVKLDLSLSGYTLEVPSSTMPNLKCLRLHAIVFADTQSAQNLISPSPLIEELSLHYCKWSPAQSSETRFSTPKLKLLEIIEREDSDDEYVDARKVCFLGDELISFVYGGPLLTGYQICWSKVIRAEIRPLKRII